MKIESITFEGFKAPHRNAKVKFSNENVTVIYGDNGCGKTTFLKAIGSYLSQDDESLKNLGIKKIVCELLVDGQRHTIITNQAEVGFDWKNFNNSALAHSQSLSLGVERGISTQAMRIEPEQIFEFFEFTKYGNELINNTAPSRTSLSSRRKRLFDLAEELSSFLRRRSNTSRYNRPRSSDLDFKKKHLYLQGIKIESVEELLLQKYRVARFTATRKIQSALFDTLSIAIDIENESSEIKNNDENFPQKLLENRDRIIEALDDGEENKFKSSIVEILSKIDQEHEMQKVIEHSLLSQLFKNMIGELDFEKLMLSSITLLVDKFNGYLIDEKKLVVNASEAYIEIEGSRHSVNELSSGERHILTFLALVLFEGEDRNFLIIDEPEISLNIKWQRELMTIFSTLLPKTQIIVASHSPALAKRNPNFLKKLEVWGKK